MHRGSVWEVSFFSDGGFVAGAEEWFASTTNSVEHSMLHRARSRGATIVQYNNRARSGMPLPRSDARHSGYRYSFA